MAQNRLDLAPHPNPTTPLLNTLDNRLVKQIVHLDPYDRLAWGWFFGQCVLQLYAATYFGCLGEDAELPSWAEWLSWPAIISSAVVNFMLHVACGQSSFHLIKNYVQRGINLHARNWQRDEHEGYIERVSLVFESLSLLFEVGVVGAVAGLSLLPYLSIGSDVKEVCPFFSNLPSQLLTVVSFSWVGLPASAAAFPWISAPLNTLFQKIDGLVGLSDYVPGLARYWARQSISLPLDKMQEIIKQALNQAYWEEYKNARTSPLRQSLRDFSHEPDILALDRYVSIARTNWQQFTVNVNKREIMQACLTLCANYQDNVCVVPSRSLERFLIFLLGWVSYFPYFPPMVQDNSLHPIFKLASILDCSFLCVIAANSVSSIVHSFFPEKDHKFMANFFYGYRSLSYTLAGTAILLIIAAILSAAPCLGLSQQGLLEGLPQDSWLSILAVIVFVIGTAVFNFAFCTDVLQEAANTYYTTAVTDNTTAKHLWALMLCLNTIKGLALLKPEVCEALIREYGFVDNQEQAQSEQEMRSSLAYRNSGSSRSSSSDTEGESAQVPQALLVCSVPSYQPLNDVMDKAEVIAVLLLLVNVGLSSYYQQTKHGVEIYAIHFLISLFCTYLIPMKPSCEQLKTVTCSCLLSTLVGLGLYQGLVYLLGSLSSNEWHVDPNKSNDVTPNQALLTTGLVVGALYLPHAGKLVQEWRSSPSQACGL